MGVGWFADVWRQHHDEMAAFMAAMAPDGAAQAVNLTGLTLQAEMDLALRIGQYRSAADFMAPEPSLLLSTVWDDCCCADALPMLMLALPSNFVCSLMY